MKLSGWQETNPFFSRGTEIPFVSSWKGGNGGESGVTQSAADAAMLCVPCMQEERGSSR